MDGKVFLGLLGNHQLELDCCIIRTMERSSSKPKDSFGEVNRNAIRSGDHEIWNIIFKKYFDSLTRYLSLRFEDLDAEDIAQDALLAAYKKCESFGQNESNNFSSWIYAIARNKAIDATRSDDCRPYDYLTGNELSPISEEPNQIIESEEIIHKLRASINSLPDHERRIILLRYFEANRFNKIALIEDKSVKSVTSTASRARDKLRKVIKEME